MAGSMSGYYGNDPNLDPYSGSPIDAQWQGQGQNGQQMRYVVSNNNSQFGGHQGRTLQGYAMNPQTGQWEMSGGGSNFNSTEDYQRFLQEGVGPNGDVNSIANWAAQNPGVAYQPRRDPSGISANYQPAGAAVGASATGQPQNTTSQGMQIRAAQGVEQPISLAPQAAETDGGGKPPVQYLGPPSSTADTKPKEPWYPVGPDGGPQKDVAPQTGNGTRTSAMLSKSAGQGAGYYDQQGQWHKTAFSAKKPTAASGTSVPPPPTSGGTPGGGPSGPAPPPVNPPPRPRIGPVQGPQKPPAAPGRPAINPGGYVPPIQNAAGSIGKPTGGQIGPISGFPMPPNPTTGQPKPGAGGPATPSIAPPINPPVGIRLPNVPVQPPLYVRNPRTTISRNPSGQSLSSALGIAR